MEKRTRPWCGERWLGGGGIPDKPSKLAAGDHMVRIEYRPRSLMGIRWIRACLFSP